jgi:hypothetical protein
VAADGRVGYTQLTAKGELGGAMVIGEIPVTTDAAETVGQDMQEKAADKLFGGQGHQLVLAGMAVIFPAKAHAAVFEREQPTVVDGHWVGIEGEIGEDLPGAGERGFGIDDP